MFATGVALNCPVSRGPSNRERKGQTLSQNLAIWEEFIRTKAHILRRGNDAWPSHKILLQLAMEHADDSPVTLAAENFINKKNVDGSG